MNRETFRTNGQGQLLRSIESMGELGASQVRVAIGAVALNFRDLAFLKGNAFREPVTGRIPATDAVGTVLEVGRDVTQFAIGDRVCSTVLPNWLDGPLDADKFAGSIGSRDVDGVLATEVLFEQTALVMAPAHLNDIEASTLPVAALTAWHAIVELGAIRAGDTVVIQTTGGVALFALQFAKALGAKVIVTSRSDDKLARALELGASAVINTNLHADWASQVDVLTAGVGAQLVLDMGLTDGLRQATRGAAFEATVAVIGVVKNITVDFDIFPVMNKNLRVRGVETGSRAMFMRMTEFMQRHAMHPVIDAVFDLNDVAGAFERLEQSPFGKVVIDLGHD